MSHLVNGYAGVLVAVETDEQGRPVRVENGAISLLLDHWREWIGILEGEPQVDVWKVQTARGICELHRRRYPDPSGRLDPGCWFLVRWED